MPTREDVKKALNLIHRTAEYDFFFKNLNSPDWLEPLEAEKVFYKPDDAIKIDNTIKFPFWPPAKYLIKVAPTKPQKVLEIIQNIPDTDNIRIHEDLVEAATAMPSEISISLCKDILRWLDKPSQLLLPNKVAIFTGKLFQSGYEKQALSLSNKLLDVLPSDNQNKIYTFIARNDWDYNELIKSISPQLKSIKTKIAFTALLCNKLEKAIRVERNIFEKENDFSDYSCAWRRSIEESNQNINEDVKDILVNWIRDVSESVLTENANSFGDLMNLFLKRKFPIYSRIALHLIINNTSDNDYIVSSLLNPKLAKSNDVWHEYAILLQAKFSTFNSDSKENILNFISNLDFSLSGDANERNQRRRYQYYYLIQNDLSKEWKTKFDLMKEKYGVIEHPEYLVYFTGVKKILPISPISIDDLKSKSIEEIRQFLSEWKPPIEERFGESTYGLVQVIEKIVSEKYQEFSENISLFKLNNSSIVRAIIQGFSIVLLENKNLSWEAILGYLHWAVNHQDLATNTENPDIDMEMEWSGVKDTACHFLEKAFSANKNIPPITSRELIWKIISSALNDSDPDTQREERINDKDYYHIAINSIRGIALECAIRYGLWVMQTNAIKKKDSNKNHYMELFAALEEHLDINFDKSKAVHSIYGRWLPWLFLLDHNWTKNNINLIFPSTISEESYRFSAWDAYLLFSTPYDDVFDAIQDQYLTALDYIDPNEEANSDRPTTRLVEQIVLFYLRGKIPLDSPIIIKLYEKSNPKIRNHIISFMGRLLSDDTDIEKRAIDFWKFRVYKCNEINDWKELVELGWWAQSNQLPALWFLEQALFILKKQSYIHPARNVMEKLITLTSDYPYEVAEVFQLIVDNKVTEHGFFLWENMAENLISELLKTKARKETINIIQKLGGYGLIEYGRFLND